MNASEEDRNKHYSEQTGHALRGVHERAARQLGLPAKVVPGYDGVEQMRRRRTMRRITDSNR